MQMWIVWLIAAAVFLIVEIGTTALVSIWFVPASAIAAAVAAFLPNVFWLQFLVFAVLSAVCFIISKKIYKDRIKLGVNKTDTDSTYIGKTAVAVTEISKTSGEVLLGDIYWRSVTDGEDIKKDENVVVKAVNGTCLTVEKISEKSE